MFRSVVHCILLVHVIFTRLYIFEYKFNNMEDVYTPYFENSTFDVVTRWSGRVGSVFRLWSAAGQVEIRQVGSDHRECTRRHL